MGGYWGQWPPESHFLIADFVSSISVISVEQEITFISCVMVPSSDVITSIPAPFSSLPQKALLLFLL